MVNGETPRVGLALSGGRLLEFNLPRAAISLVPGYILASRQEAVKIR
jgi:hypothetical protein